MARTFALAAVLALAVAGCGGDEEGTRTATARIGEADGDLVGQANRAERIVNDRVQRLFEIRSPRALASEAEAAQRDVRTLAADIAGVEAAENLTDEKQQLEANLRQLAEQIEHVQLAAENEDVGDARRQLDDLSRPLDRLNRVIEDIRGGE